MNTRKAVVLSCEHANNKIPSQYKKLFIEAENVLKTHRGYDIGAVDLFNLLESDYVTYRQIATASRLLVDVNRSLHRQSLFSEFTKSLSKANKEQILTDYYHSFRHLFENQIRELLQKQKTVLHLSVHSFTPELNGKVRQTDFGILYNPERTEEKRFAEIWKAELKKILPQHRVRFNYPFRGKPDGFVRYFRDLEKEEYLGIEFEMNQKYAGDTSVKKRIALSFKQAVDVWVKL